MVSGFTTEQKKMDAPKSEVLIAAMGDAKLETPLACHYLYYQEKCRDLIRFRCMDDFVCFWGTEGYIVEKKLITEDKEDTEVVHCVREQSLLWAIIVLVNSPQETNSQELVGMLKGVLADTEAMSGTAGNDLQNLLIFLNPDSTAEQKSESKTLMQELITDQAYNGILRPITDQPGYAALIEVKDATASEKAVDLVNAAITMLQATGLSGQITHEQCLTGLFSRANRKITHQQ